MGNFDTECVSVADESKWLINRIDTAYKVLLEEFKTVLARNEEIGKTEIKRLKGRRNNILSALGIALTVLLGIHSVDNIEQGLFFSILVIIFSIGLGIFILFSRFIIITDTFFAKLYDAIQESEETISYTHGFFISQTSNSQLLTYQQLWNWFLMNKSLSASLSVPILEVLLSDKGRFLNPRLEPITQEAKETVKTLSDFKEGEFQKEDNLPNKTVQFIDDALKSFKKLKKQIQV